MEKEIQLIINNLDFTGSRSSYFNNWSTEFDWEGEGNKNREKRKHYLKLMLQFFNEVKARMKNFPKDYQIWIQIDESNSANDSVFIHTPSPGKTPFPIVLKARKGYMTKENTIAEFISKSKLEAYEGMKGDSKVIILFDSKTGIAPVQS